MKLVAYRVQRFRSVVDTGWRELSHDGVTVLVGQNESGKTSILEGIELFQTGELQDDDLRDAGSWPSVSLRFLCTGAEIGEALKAAVNDADVTWPEVAGELAVELTREWSSDEDVFQSTNVDLIDSLIEAIGSTGLDYDDSDLAQALINRAPRLVLFETRTGVIPDAIAFESLTAQDGDVEGYVAAANIVKVAQMDLDAIASANDRIAENAVADANQRLNDALSTYWRQQIGNRLKVRLEAERDRDKAGVLRLSFWVKDGRQKFYPHQRSLGLRWYLSFFLQLLAARDEDVVFLIDEPGAGLHARAQADVLKLLDELRASFPIVYSTHSPYLIDTTRIGRITVVQRADADDDRCPTTLIGAHELGAASRDALSPIYTAMGVDFSHQNVIAPDRNLLVEEVSAYYYIHAFFRLAMPTATPPHLLPATGADNIPVLANLMLGWGLKFAILLDDDSKGRSVRDRLRQYTFAGDDAACSRLIVRTPGTCIEEVFTKTDYKAHVLGEPKVAISSVCEVAGNRSKGVDALSFYDAVLDGRVTMAQLQAGTTERMKKLLEKILSATG